jgi:sugar lactone lactonase YvrE
MHRTASTDPSGRRTGEYEDGNVFFTDHMNNRIVKWSAADGVFSDWLKPAGRAIGTYFDTAGNLIVAATENGELWSIAPDKNVRVLVTNFEGKVFNSPNDLWIRPDGGIYFTDPDFYTARDPSTQMESQNVYFVTPDYKTVTRVATDLTKPGGIIGTPDGKILYDRHQRMSAPGARNSSQIKPRPGLCSVPPDYFRRVGHSRSLPAKKYCGCRVVPILSLNCATD